MSTPTVASAQRCKRLRQYSFFILLSLFLWGCESTPTKKSAKGFGGKGLAGLNPQQLQTYENALAQLENKQPSAAEKTLSKLLRAQPNVAEIWLNIALSQYQQENYKASRATLDGLLDKSDSIAQAHNLAGLLAQKNGLFQKAESHYKKALSLKPNYVNALYNMALLKDVYHQDVAEAIKYYEKYVHIQTDDQQTKDWLAQLKSSL